MCKKFLSQQVKVIDLYLPTTPKSPDHFQADEFIQSCSGMNLLGLVNSRY